MAQFKSQAFGAIFRLVFSTEAPNVSFLFGTFDKTEDPSLEFLLFFNTEAPIFPPNSHQPGTSRNQALAISSSHNYAANRLPYIPS